MSNKTDAVLESQLDGAQQRINELEGRVNDLDDEVRNLTDELEGRPGVGIIDQLETLAVDVDSSSAPQTPEQWARCLRIIAAGDDWQNGTWK